MTTPLLAGLVGLAAGSIPFGLLLARLAGGVDPRTVGSGNVGATNVARAGGMKLGIATLVLDAAKGLVPALAATPAGETAVALAGVGAVVGHCFSPWLRFRGGKGVATLLGACGVVGGWPALLGFVLTWGGTFAATRFASLASLLASAATCVVAWATGRPLVSVAALGAAAAVSTVRHSANLRRLLDGTEPRFRAGGAASEPDDGGVSPSARSGEGETS